MSERFNAAGPWPDGRFYIWDRDSSRIVNPDSGECNLPWREMRSWEEAVAAGARLNELEGNYAMQALIRAARIARDKEDRLT